MIVKSWWPPALGQSMDDILASDFAEDDARLAIAREHGFPDWASVAALGDARLDPAFEAAVDVLMAGDALGLGNALEEKPTLNSATSAYGHQATLLHYIAANGVESHRQVTPLNAATLAQMLIDAGADRSAHANMYGGGQTPLALAATSAHPAEAGVADALCQVLRPEATP